MPRYDEGGRRVRCSHRQPCCPYNIAPAESHTHVTHVAPLSFHRHASGARPYFIVFINPALTCAQPGTYDIGTTATGVKPHDRALSSSLYLYVSDGVVSGFFRGISRGEMAAEGCASRPLPPSMPPSCHVTWVCPPPS